MKTLAFIIILALALGSCDNNQKQNIAQQKYLDSLDIANAPKMDGKINKLYIDLEDSSLTLVADMHRDHRIFGFEKADTASKRVILFSIFTNDVENNPYNCSLGSYYDLSGLRESVLIKYNGTKGDFIEIKTGDQQMFFVHKAWVNFDVYNDPSEDDSSEKVLEEYGLVESIENGAYPMYVVRVNFERAEHIVDFNLNIEAVPFTIEELNNSLGKYARIQYKSELQPDLMDVHYKKRSVLGDTSSQMNKRWVSFEGTLSGAESPTMSDLPSQIKIESSDGNSMYFEIFVDEALNAVNGKIVTVYYDEKVLNSMVGLSASAE